MSENWPEGFAWVVGGSGGLGAAIAERLAADDFDVLLTYGGNQAGAEAVAERIRARGRRAAVRQLSLPDGDPGALDGVRSLVFAVGDDIDMTYLSATSPEAMRQAVDTELHGFHACARAALPHLREVSGSMVALVSAGLGQWPPGDGLSVVPKAGIQALIRGFAREEGRNGVRANAVAVGVAEAGIFLRLTEDASITEQWLEAARRNIALRRFGAAQEVANAVAFLAGSESSYVTGQTLYVDGGYAL